MQQRNLFLFAALTLLLLLIYTSVRSYLAPPAPPKKPSQAEQTTKDKPDKNKPAPAEEFSPKEPIPLPVIEATPEKDLLALGSPTHDSNFHLYVKLDPLGAGVRSVLLNKFQKANEFGQPVWTSGDEKKPVPLELVPAEANKLHPSNLLYHYKLDSDEPTNVIKPLDTLGRIRWEVVKVGDKAIQTRQVEKDGEQRQQDRVSFRATVDGVEITKTYTLVEKEYHVGLEVRLKRLAGASNQEKVRFRYQLTGAHGLPVEGKWYTSVFRNALIGLERASDGLLERDLQDLRQISRWQGGKAVFRDEQNFIRYAGVAVQYFASAIVVDNDQEGDGPQDFLHWARPTLESSVTKGTVERVAADGSRLIVKVTGGENQTFQVPDEDGLREQALALAPRERGGKKVKKQVALLHYSGSYRPKLEVYPQIVKRFLDPDATPELWENDITVRVISEEIPLEENQEVVHRYLLYNGPVKVALLGPSMAPSPQISQALTDRYVNQLHLNTFTDYHSPSGFGKFASTIYLTDVIIKCTNLMHWILGHLRRWIPSYGLCIIVLTILVRGLMFPISRKQAIMSIRMQELAPKLKELQEKHKEDKQKLMQEQMKLYRQHGVNPLGTCWFLLLQMPIFMGLYWALQESVHLRLAAFWPTWIVNLSAPDMLFRWGEWIPIISHRGSYEGGFLSFFYLGPYFNLLPIIAVTLMILQQKMYTPPPADEQQAMQQKMMKYMMIVFCLFFYKVAAGLCLYFIASSLWGFAERKLVPKKKDGLLPPREPGREGIFEKFLSRMQAAGRVTPAEAPGSAAVSTEAIISRSPGEAKPGPGRGRTRKQKRSRRRQERTQAGDPDNGKRSWLSQRLQQLREWWAHLLEQADASKRKN
jgi:YidC/Oxa1 family membrane protein insertase